MRSKGCIRSLGRRGSRDGFGLTSIGISLSGSIFRSKTLSGQIFISRIDNTNLEELPLSATKQICLKTDQLDLNYYS